VHRVGEDLASLGVFSLNADEPTCDIITLDEGVNVCLKVNPYVVSNDKKVRCAFPRSYRRGRM
jgi:hypothetical protein